MSDEQTAAPAASPTPDPAPAVAAAAPAQADAAPAAAPAPAAPAAAAQPAAPEAYEFTLPEGVKLDDAVLGEFKTLAKDAKLPQDAAQKLVDLGVKMQQGSAEQLQAAIAAQGEKWAADAKADKEYGGDSFDANLAVASKALSQFATPEFKAFLNESKLGNHPEMLRTFYRIGQAISEDGLVPGRAGASSDPAKTMFPTMN